MTSDVYKSERILVQPKLLADIDGYLSTHNLGNRGFEDGERRKQLVGLLGEIVLIEKLTGVRINLQDRKDGYDGGFDFLHKGYRVDVKTMERKSFVRPEFVNNFYIMQVAYP